ncbi:hypothetical protein [uncultured Acinetobacter sp.]|uniref:hypothetical protein n=1 Tax=uncultured Acinetobacter sp. TaxID=165433 RepID=UPI002584AE0A|nr:hypothetical protein [uncultured Acinetobacter sp.]
MSGFKSFSQKTTNDNDSKLSKTHTHMPINSSNQPEPDLTPKPEIEQSEQNEKSDPNNK